MKRDHVTACISIVMGAIVAVMTWQLPDSRMPGDIGPKVFPAICAGILLVCGAALLIKKPAERHNENYSKEELCRLALVFGTVVLYVIFMQLIGFWLPTLFILFILCSMFMPKSGVSVWKRAAFACFMTVGIYFLFEKAMMLQLPRGIFF